MQVAECTTIKFSNVIPGIIRGPGEEALISDSNAGDYYRNSNLAGIKFNHCFSCKWQSKW